MSFVVFGGTTEGRMLSHRLAELGAEVTVCVATESGQEEQGEAPGLKVLCGRLDAGGMERVVTGAALCVDATHPYAVEASRNIQMACGRAGIELVRLHRRVSNVPESAEVFETASSAAAWLEATRGNILLTTGAKELEAFACLGGGRLYPRVLPLAGSLAACKAAGVPRSNILALQGPFSRELNEAMIRQFQIRYLVTKDGGQVGGFDEKAEAAAATGTQLVVIRRPWEDGLDYEAVLTRCKEVMVCR